MDTFFVSFYKRFWVEETKFFPLKNQLVLIKPKRRHYEKGLLFFFEAVRSMEPAGAVCGFAASKWLFKL